MIQRLQSIVDEQVFASDEADSSESSADLSEEEHCLGGASPHADEHCSNEKDGMLMAGQFLLILKLINTNKILYFLKQKSVSSIITRFVMLLITDTCIFQVLDSGILLIKLILTRLVLVPLVQEEMQKQNLYSIA